MVTWTNGTCTYWPSLLCLRAVPRLTEALATLDGMTPVPSDYAYDQLPLYAAWEYKPMLLTRVAVEAVKTWEREFE